MKQSIKVVLMIVISSLLLIVLFSPGLAGIRLFGGSALESLCGFGAILAVIAAVCLGTMPKKQEAPMEDKKQHTIQSLSGLSRTDVFTVNAKCLIEQIQRFEDKLYTVDEIILKKFNASELSYARFQQVMKSTAELFYAGIQSAINRMTAFDEDDYRRVTQGHAKLSQTLLDTKMKLYREHLDFISATVEKNEELLVRMDKLLLETSKMTSVAVENLDNMQAIRELDALTEQARQYK